MRVNNQQYFDIMKALDKEPDAVVHPFNHQDNGDIPWDQTVAIQGDCVTSSYETQSKGCGSNDSENGIMVSDVQSENKERSVAKINTHVSDNSISVVKVSKNDASVSLPKKLANFKKIKVWTVQKNNYNFLLDLEKKCSHVRKCVEKNSPVYVPSVEISREFANEHELSIKRKMYINGKEYIVSDITKDNLNQVIMYMGYDTEAWNKSNDWGRRSIMVSIIPETSDRELVSLRTEIN